MEPATDEAVEVCFVSLQDFDDTNACAGAVLQRHRLMDATIGTHDIYVLEGLKDMVSKASKLSCEAVL